MAEWQYVTKTVHFDDATFGDQLEDVLKEYGENGWELVQVLPPALGKGHLLIFKTEKPFLETD